MSIYRWNCQPDQQMRGRSDMSFDENIQIFVTESQELLEDMEQALLALERAPNDADLIDRIFRAAHTIKGSAGLFGFDHVISFTHVVENLLDDVRNCLLPVNDDLISLLMRAKDYMGVLVGALPDEPVGSGEERQELMGMLEAFQSGGSTSVSAAMVEVDPDAVVCGAFHISVRLGTDTFRQGFAPVLLLEQLQDLGTIEQAHLVTEAIAPLSELDAEDCYLGWEIVLKSSADKQQIARVFEFIENARVHILPPQSKLEDYKELINQLPEDDAVLGQILFDIGTLTADELQQALNQQQEVGGLMGDILVAQASVQPDVINTALQKQEKVREAKQAQSNFVRVDAGKLDKLVNLVGELVISGAKVTELTGAFNDDALEESIEEMTVALEDMRETALSLRMVPMGSTFNRFHRVVRDTAKELEKKISLKVSGADTELDKTVIDQIGDPLMHLIRNAMDHGIEAPAERASAGKPEAGVIQLDAYHETGSIVIKISDDGRGLDAERIRSIAEQRGLVTPDQSLTKGETLRLIFAPGFSTAETVSNLSGRGVGMDVVRRNIESLRGSVDVTSEAGLGALITIRLPLTLAIIDGFHVAVGGGSFIIPLDTMVECVTLTPAQRDEVEARNYLNLRDEVLPLIDLRASFEINSASADDSSRQNVVVVQFAGKKAGLLVDALHGDAQAVIKPLGDVFQGIKGFAGFTILGSGQVALIMDVPDMIKLAVKNDGHRYQSKKMAETAIQ